MSLLSFDSGGQGVCSAAQMGHFHLNRGPWMPSGVTLSTVGTFVPAVTVCGAEEETSIWPTGQTPTHKLKNIYFFSSIRLNKWPLKNKHAALPSVGTSSTSPTFVQLQLTQQRNANRYSLVIRTRMSNLAGDQFSYRLPLHICSLPSVTELAAFGWSGGFGWWSAPPKKGVASKR